MSNDEIIRLIGKIRERYDQVHESSGNAVRIEVDLLRADIRELYEKISLLTQPESPPDVAKPLYLEPEIMEEVATIMVEPVSESEFAPEPASEVYPVQHVDEDIFSPEPLQEMNTEELITPSPAEPEPKPEILSPNPIPEPVFEMEKPKEADPPVLPQTPAQRPASEPSSAVHLHETTTPGHTTLDLFGTPTSTLADKFRDEKRSISEKLSQQTIADKSIGSKLRLKIIDLRSAIGINDRFIFINELFEGDMRMYDDMLGRLNTCASLQEAIEVFNHAKAVQGWSDELSSVERLLDFIHRRYD
ncbi:MAG TPA: hypothetical protein VF298_01640 [Bacteroidales bacterium]